MWEIDMKLRIGLIFLSLIMTSFAGVLCTSQPDYGLVDLNATAVPDHVTLSWTSDPMTTQTVTWRTDSTVQNGSVEYSMDPNLKDKESIAANVSTLKTDLGDQNIHTATITGLAPGNRYYYRVGDGTKDWSPVYSFMTEAEDTNSFKFLVFGDTQGDDDANPDYSLWQSTLHNAYKANPDARFFTVVGDEAQAGLSNLHWNHWFAACKGVIESISYVPVAGNTECRDMARDHADPSIYMGQFNVPNNGPYSNDQAYSFDYGNMHIIVLDSQLREEQEINPDLLNDQKLWLDKDLSRTTKEWKMAIWHKPPYYTRVIRTNEGIKAAFAPIIDKYHVDLVFNGHDHAYSRTYPINNDSIVSTPALGTVYVVAGRSGQKVIDDNVQNIWCASFYNPQDMPNYIVVEVNGSRMEMKCFKMDGTLIDDYIIDKTSGDTPRTIVPVKYNEPRLAINGVLLNEPMLPTSPSKINGKWYFPIKPVVLYLGGSESVSGENETLSLRVKNYIGPGIVWSDKKVHAIVLTNASTKATLDNTTISLPDKVIVDDDKNFLISADDMKTLCGFTWKYDSDMNILFLINPSKPGE